MATKELRTRIQLRFDTLSNWESINPILGAGEAAIAINEANGQLILKVGDGDRNYKTLAKPIYEIADIPGLSERLGEIAGEIGDTDTQYQIVKDGDAYQLQSKGIGGEWANATGRIDLSGYVLTADLEKDYATLEALSEVATEVTTLKTKLSGAMHFKGIVEVDPTTLTGYADGDVVVYKGTGKEYVWVDGKFEILGDATRIGAVETRVGTLEGRVGNIEADYVAREELTERLESYATKKDYATKAELNNAIAAEVTRSNTYADNAAKNAVDNIDFSEVIFVCGGASEYINNDPTEPDEPVTPDIGFYVNGVGYNDISEGMNVTWAQLASTNSDFVIMTPSNDLVIWKEQGPIGYEDSTVLPSDVIVYGRHYVTMD